jgi:hypothetical protein
MKKYFLLTGLCYLFCTNGQAQLNGSLTKTKNKMGNTSQTAFVETGNTPIEKNNAAKNQAYPDNYEYWDNNTFSEIREFEFKPTSFNPLKKLRKKGEKGTFHFAKDYPELAAYTKPYNNNVTIRFAPQPFGSGGTAQNNFTSKDHIYARLQSNGGSIKDAFKTGDGNIEMKVSIVVYDDSKDAIRQYDEKVWNLYLRPAETEANFVDFDILPMPSKTIPHTTGNDFFYYSPFYKVNDEEYLPNSGNYRIGVELSLPVKNEWGKEDPGNIIQCGGYFDYNFSVADMAVINKEKATVSANLKEAAKTAIVPLPQHWAAKSAAPAMGVSQEKIMSMYINSFTDKLKGWKVVKFYASPSAGGWQVEANSLGIPLYRFSKQWYSVFLKKEDGSKCCFQNFGLRQQYNGGGTYGAAFVDKEDFQYLDCAGMK